MDPDKFDLFRHVSTDPNVALDLLRGLEDRSYNQFRKHGNQKQSREIFAEDELVRKKGYDEMRCEMPGQPRSTFLMVFSPDGSKVASTHGNHNIYVTDIKSGKNIKTLIGHPRTPWCIAFHPTSNQIVASGCLGGEVRIWDLSGGSEVWTAGNQSVIASIAFHPNDRVLVIATYNELYFWDWSRPEPFVQVATANPKEKIRYVAFDKLGHKLITGIANSPQTRWERVRAPVPVPRQAERSASPYRLRITPRLVNSMSPQEREYFTTGVRTETPTTPEPPRDSMSSVPERERRITASYRNLLREYEQLVQRYLKVYKPPTMIDRGTDPMEINPNSSTSSSSTQAPDPTNPDLPRAEPETSESPETEEPQPSTSQSCVSSLVMPSRILAMKRLPTTSTQTLDSRKHKSSDTSEEPSQEKRSKSDEASPTTSSHTETATQTQSPRKVLVIKEKSPQPGPSTSQTPPPSSSSAEASSSNYPQPSTSRELTSADDLLSNIRPIAEEVRNRFLPIIKSLPACDRPKLIRRFENSRALERLKFRQVCPTFTKKPNRRPVQSSDGSSSEDEQISPTPRPNPDTSRNLPPTQSVPSDLSMEANNAPNIIPSTSSVPSSSSAIPSSSSNISGVRNFIMELEQLLMTILMTEIEGNDSHSLSNNSAASTSVNTPTTTNSPTNLVTTAPSTSTQAEDQSMRSSPVYMSANRDQDLIRPNAVLCGNSIFRRLIQRQDILVQARANLVQQLESRTSTAAAAAPPPPPEDQPRPGSSSVSVVSTSSARTSAPIYTRTYPRRRLSCHRISAFMPTRVNYNRTSMRYRRVTTPRLNPRFPPQTYPIDEPINYSQRPNAEDLPHEAVEPSLSEPPETLTTSPEQNSSLGSMYSSIVQDLETSLNDVRNIRASNRPGETSDMLSSFSESLENIMNQSDTILRNLGGSMSMLPGYNESSEGSSRPQPSEPHLSFNDQSFYVGYRPDPNRDVLNLSLRQSGGRSVVESDHNYPRNPGTPPSQNPTESMSPLMTSLHLTISYIQRQARLLRQQVESIERIDRAMFEVEQLQLIRQLILEFLRYVRSLAGESRSTGMSSVRQMMAGTRISDSSPYDSQSEEPSPSNPPPSTSTATPSTSEQTQPRPRTSGRKTYPPSRLHRLQRHNRRSVFVNLFPRRYAARPDRGLKHSGPCRTASARPPPEPSNPLRQFVSYSLINSSSLNLMAARLEHLLTDQTRVITRPQDTSSQSTSRPSAATAMEERMLSLRLHDCALRMDRILATRLDGSRFRNTRGDSVVVTQDGATRFPARHFLSLVVDRMSKHVEDLGGANISQSIRGQIHNVLAMALLLSDLLLLQLVDSIPPPAGMNLDVERESLTSRIDQMCGQMLQNRFSGHSHHLTRSLQHMRLTMRHAYRALGQTYNARRNAMLPNRVDTSRRQLLNIYLRNLNRRRQNLSATTTDQTTSSSESNARENSSNPGPSTSSAAAAAESNLHEMTRGWGGLRDLIMRYSDNTGEDEDIAGASATQDTRERSPRAENPWSNNSDDNDDESEWYLNNNSARSTNLYRTNNVNLVHNNEEAAASGNSANARPWNVPSVQVNDVPISEQPTLFQQRIMSHRQRLAERVSELRSFPQMSVLRPRFLHPLYASVNPFDADLDDPQRETNYDFDMITTVTPNHRIQMWDISSGHIPVINNPLKNIIVSECKIHNDASVDIAKDGTILVTLLPSGGYLNVTNKLGVYSLKWDTLGQCLYTTSFEQNAVSVALSPLSRHLVVGLASRRVSIVPSDRWTMARIFIIDQKNIPGDRLPVLRELGQSRDSRATNYKSVNCIRWLPTSGQGLIYATNTGQLVILT